MLHFKQYYDPLWQRWQEPNWHSRAVKDSNLLDLDEQTAAICKLKFAV